MRRSVAFAVVALLAALAVPMVRAPFGSVASAYACAPGSVFNTFSGICIDTLSGAGSGTAGAVTSPVAVREPSSVLAGANGSGGTPSNNANLATLNGTDPAGKVRLAARVGSAVAVIGAAVTGYQIGALVDTVECRLGVAALCLTDPTPDYARNGDIGADPHGWTGQTWPWSGAGSAAFGATAVTNLHPNLVESTLGYLSAVSLTDIRSALSESYTVAGGYTQPFIVYDIYCQSTAGGAAVHTIGGQDLHVGVPLYTGGFTATGPGTWTVAHSTTAFGGEAGCSGAYPRFDHLEVASWSLQSPGLAGTDSTDAWWPDGNPGRPVLATDPARFLVTTKTCHPATGADVLLTATSALFHESDAAWPAFPQPGQCPAGTALTVTRVVETTSGLPDKSIWSVTVPTTITGWQQNYPQCGGGACRLGLVKVGPAGTDLGDCFAQAGRCEGWFADPSKVSDYQCTYGLPGSQANVALSECNVYSPTFDAQAQARGQVHGDPATGVIPTTSVDTTVDPAVLPGAGGGSCWPSGWGVFNPAAWVLLPIKCALVWAFVPDPSTLTSLESSVTDSLNASGVGAWFSALGTLFGSLGGSGSGCTGPTVVFPLTSTSMQPFNACSAPMSTVAGLSYAFSTVLIVVFGAMAGIRALGSAFGYHIGIGERAKASI